ncbi:OmpA family protein [Thiosocius teredinicola]|uniref:OmpA family protein n=1 Tax=Thiosocius teredinicola TaxID=1973002 RepID=UPI000F79D2DB
MSRSTAILVALASLLLLTWFTVALRYEPIESDLTERVKRALSANAINNIAISARGRDLTLEGEVARQVSVQRVAGIAADVRGVRSVDVSGIRRRQSLLDPNDPLHPRFDVSKIEKVGGDLSNPMSAATCQRMMARLAAARSVRFVAGSASPMPESYPVLGDLARLAYQCPGSQIVIGAHTSGIADRNADRLSLARAQAIEQFFYIAGITAERMQVVNYGNSQPIAPNTTPQGRAANRRITFDIVPFQ